MQSGWEPLHVYNRDCDSNREVGNTLAQVGAIWNRIKADIKEYPDGLFMEFGDMVGVKIPMLDIMQALNGEDQSHNGLSVTRTEYDSSATIYVQADSYAPNQEMYLLRKEDVDTIKQIWNERGVTS